MILYIIYMLFLFKCRTFKVTVQYNTNYRTKSIIIFKLFRQGPGKGKVSGAENPFLSQKLSGFGARSGSRRRGSRC